MSNRSQKVLRLGGAVSFGGAVLLILLRRAGARDVLSAFCSALFIGVPIAGFACLAAAVVSSQVRRSARAHPLFYIAWAVAGVVLVCLLVSAVAATAKVRYGPSN